MKPDTSDAGTLAFAEAVAPLADGVRVTVLSAICKGCGEDIWPFGEGVTYTVAAAVLREIAQCWHTDDCPGPLLFESAPLLARHDRDEAAP